MEIGYPHELGTNSIKYGVLSGTQGTIAVSWEVIEIQDRAFLRLIWNEQDGPRVQNIATEAGFGSVVLRRVAPQALSGSGELLFGSNGLTWILEAPLDSVGGASSFRAEQTRD